MITQLAVTTTVDMVTVRYITSKPTVAVNYFISNRNWLPVTVIDYIPADRYYHIVTDHSC